MPLSLQQTYAPRSICFGCGPANPDGLQLNSFVEGEELVAEWRPEKKYEAFVDVVNGGILGALLDCHCNWTAAYHLMRQAGDEKLPSTVTAEYTVTFLAPTPATQLLHLRAHVVDLGKRSARIEGHLAAEGTITATCRAAFVSVGPNHPAYHRW